MSAEARDHLGHQAVAPEENVRIVDAEGRQAEERTRVRRLDEVQGRRRHPQRRGHGLRMRAWFRQVQRRILAQDRALELLQAP